MSISVAENISFLIQSADLVNVVNASFAKTDGAATDFESTGSPVAIPQAVVGQDLGFALPTCIGRLVTVLKLLIQTDVPCVLTITFATGAAQTIPLSDVLLINGSIKKVLVSTPTGAINLKYAAAGLLS